MEDSLSLMILLLTKVIYHRTFLLKDSILVNPEPKLSIYFGGLFSDVLLSQVVQELLCEMNPDVVGSFRVERPECTSNLSFETLIIC